MYAQKGRLPVVCSGAAVLLCVLISAAAGAAWRAQEPAASPGGAAELRILDVHVKSFKVERASMAEALLALRSADVDHIVIGFERLPHLPGAKGGPISLDVHGATVGEIIRRLCELDPRYEYAAPEAVMIDVWPKGAKNNPNDLLNFKVPAYDVDANVWPFNLIEHIDQDIPALRSFMERKHEEWLRKMGNPPGGSMGSILSGNAPPPRFTLSLRNLTIRQILDAISLKTIHGFKSGARYEAPGFHATRLTPTGWEYDFVVAPDASTGLGGYPSWKRF
jgi:hypothetical protein